MARENSNWARSMADALSLAATFAAALLLGYYAGKYLDGRFGIAPWGTVIFVLIGMATGLKMMYERAMKKQAARQEVVVDTGPKSKSVFRYSPSQDLIGAMTEAQKMLSEIDPDVTRREEKPSQADQPPKDE